MVYMGKMERRWHNISEIRWNARDRTRQTGNEWNMNEYNTRLIEPAWQRLTRTVPRRR